MNVASGTRLGPYEIVSLLGAGGMGEVYRARDTKLNRDVALKTLPDAFALDPDRFARFKREAQVLASLNHPNIAAIYGLEEANGVDALVMELVDGPTLADRIEHGPIPIDEALQIAKQIAEGLDAAHEQGVVHRDLKPANIKVRPDGTVKVLDFGLAKAFEPVGVGGASATMSPTLSVHATQAGIILGTAAYMSPEQARGRPVDRRADIWAFGAVLYEMLTGGRAFPGEDTSDTLATVLKDDPDWSALPRDVPPSVRRLLRRCLEKDPHKRLRAIGDAGFDLDERDESTGLRPTVVSRWLTVLAVIGAGAFIAGAWFWSLTHPTLPPSSAVVRFSIVPPPDAPLLPESSSAVISPDGRMVVFPTGETSAGSVLRLSGLAIRALNSLTIRRLDGTEGASLPFWSPNSREVAFFTNEGKLKKVDIESGHVAEICDAADGRGGTWNRHGIIVFAPTNVGPLMRLAASGTGTPVTTLDPNGEGAGHRFPFFLPDDDHFLYLATPMHAGAYDTFIGALSGGVPQLLLSTEEARVFSPDGYVLFMRKGSVVAQRFDATRRVLLGETMALSDVPTHVTDVYLGGPALSVSATRTLAYVGPRVSTSRLVAFDQTGGQAVKIDVPPAKYVGVSVTGDGRRALLNRSISPTANDLWTVDLNRGGASRVTDAPTAINSAIYAPDGVHLAYSATRDGPYRIYRTSTAGTADELVYRSQAISKDPTSWSVDGQFLVVSQSEPTTTGDIWVIPMSGQSAPRPYLRTPFTEGQGAISPDNRWMAYVSDESGQPELYVDAFPEPRGKHPVTTTGAFRAWWRADSRQLLIASADRTQVLVADVTTGPEVSISAPRVVGHLPRGVVALDATADLERLIAIVEEGPDAALPMTLVQNWTALLNPR